MRSETVESFLAQLAERAPTPGGGATAALHAAQAAALIAMVGRYSNTARYAAHAERIAAIVQSADRLREQALQLAERDVDAFGAVGQAYQLPKDTLEHITRRSEMIAAALVDAGRVPAEVIQVAEEVLTLTEELEPIGNPNVITDVAAAEDAARAAASTARVNVEVNLGGISDVTVGTELRAAITGVDDLAIRAEKVTAAVRDRLTR
jgi:formiminotetrahydrofolate cyclodeaminase